ncbi:hypothetical protein QYM36_016486 [Artemia franciscana]|uniref:Reverse transcriptase domain-containing protein n=1 Tax=Artemia franciscana TaxID=6661 RepID=A0AA88HA14_ARTSF|nr:hypothetical protein QYM36_016486 [Artemia franciscana]
MLEDCNEMKLEQINRGLGPKHLHSMTDYFFSLAHIFNLIAESDDYPSIRKKWTCYTNSKKDASNDFSGIRAITMTPVLNMLDKALKHLDEPERRINLIAIDLKKAFDLVCHSTLKKKLLSKFNVRHFLARIIANFLANRTQCIKYKSTFSDEMPIFCGVPQGTILGPLPFLIVINELEISMLDRWKYDDDLSIAELC